MDGEDPFKFQYDQDEDGSGRDSAKGHKGLTPPQLRAAPTGSKSGARMTRSTIGGRNVRAVQTKLAPGGSNRAGYQPSVFHKSFGASRPQKGTEARTPASRSSERVASANEVGSGDFFNVFKGPKHDGPRQVSVNTRTLGTAVQGKKARRLREQSDDDEVAEVQYPDRSRRDAPRFQGAAATSRLNGTNGRANRRTDEGRNDETEPDSDDEGEPAEVMAQYSRRGNLQKNRKRGRSAEHDTWEASGAGSRRGDRRSAKRRASEGDDDGEEFQLPPAKRERPSQQTAKLDMDPEYKPASRCAVKRAPSNPRKAKPEVQVINLDSEETPQKEKPNDSEHQEGVPRRLMLENQGAGPSSTLLNEKHMFQTGSCWLGKFAAHDCTVYFDAHRLQVTVPSKFVQGGAESMTFQWSLDELAPGKSFLVQGVANDAEDRLLAFHFKGEVHPALTAYLDPRSSDFQSRMVAFELDAEEWTARLNLNEWTTDLKAHYDSMKPEQVSLCTDRPAESAALLNPKADQRQRAAALVSGHFSRPSRHQKPSIQTFHFPANDPDAVTISTSDLARLDPNEFLNDTLIDFYIKFLQVANLSDEHAGRIHIVNSFFFKKLTETAQEARKRGASREEAFRRMNKWTRKVNIFDKDYVIVPVNQSLHWSLAIIVYPGGGDALGNGKPAGTWVQKTPCILQLDSMAGGHTNVEDLLRQYLTELWLASHPDEERPSANEPLNRFSKTAMPFIQVKVPQQDNHCDCGLFLLHYVEQFIADPPPIFDRRVGSARKGHYRMSPNWFTPGEASAKRSYLRDLVIRLAAELAAGKTAILGRDNLKVLWTDVILGGSDARVGVQTRRADRARENPLKVDEPAGGRRNGPPKASVNRPRKEEGEGRTAPTSAYDEELEGAGEEGEGVADASAKGQNGARAVPLTEDVLKAALREDPGAAVDPDNPLSVDLDPSPQKRKRSTEAAAEGGDAGAAVPSGAVKAEKGREPSPVTDPLAHYRVYKELASSKAQKEASKSAALNQANNPSGPPLAEHAEVRRKGADESVPDSEDEDEAPREKKRERSGRADKSAGSGSEGDGSASEGPRKRVRSDSEGPETAPVRGGRSDGDQSLLVAGGSAGEASGGEGEAVRRKRMETSPVEGRLGAADGTADRDPSSDDSESESMRGLEGFHEDKARLSGGAGERSEAREDSLSAKKGNRAGESEGEKGPGERSRMQMVVHPAMGVLHEVDELGGSPLSDNDGEDEGGEEGATHYQGRSERGALEVALKEGGVEDEAVGKERGDDQWSGEEGGRGTGGVRGRSGDGSDGEGGRFAVRERGESPGPGTDPAWESSEEPGSFARGKKSTHRRSSSREARPPVEPQGKAELVKEITAGVIRAVSRTQGESGGPEGTERGFSEELDAGESPGPFRARWAPGEGWGAGEERLLSREEKNVRDRPAGLASFFEEESMEGEGKGDFGGNARTRGPAKSWLADGEENENEVEFLGEAVSAPSGGGLTGRSGRRAEGGAVGGKENGAPAVGGEKSAERTSVEKILQRVRPPKHWEGDPELGGTERRGKSVERQGKALSRGDGQTESASRLDRRSGPSEAMMRKTDGLLDRLLDNVQIEKSLAESRQGTELEAAAQPGLKKIDRLRRKATENLLSGSPERPSREPGYEEGLATEARFMLGEPAGLMAGGEVKPGRADSPGSPVFEPVAHDREPVSQNFTEDDDERSEPESASAEAESRDWEGTGDRGKAGPSERRGEATSDRFLKTDRAALAGNGDERSSERGTKRARTSLENDPHSRDYLAEGRRDDEAMGADTEREGKATESPDEAVQGVKIPGVFPPEPPSSGFRFLSLGEGSLLERSPLGSESGNPFVTDSGETRRRPGTREPVPAPESGATAPAEDDDCTIVSAPSRSPLFGPPGHQGTRTEATRLGSSGTGRSPRNGEVLLGGGSAGQTGKKAGEGARSFANGLAGSKGKASLLQTGAVIRRGSGQANGNGSAGKGADIRKDNGRELTGFEDLDPDEDTEGFVPERRHRQAGLTGGAKGMETEDRWQAGGGNGSPLREGAEGGVGDWANAERLVAGGRKGPRLSFDSWQEGDMPEGEGSRRKVVSLKKLMRDTRAQEGETSGESRGNEREERTPPPRDVAIESSSRHAVANGVGVMEKPAVAKREVWTLDSDEDEHMVVDEAAEKRRQRPKRKTREEKSAERKQKLRELLDERESGGAARTLIPV